MNPPTCILCEAVMELRSRGVYTCDCIGRSIATPVEVPHRAPWYTRIWRWLSRSPSKQGEIQ